MAEDESKQRVLAELTMQLELSRQQQQRLGEALTRVVSMLDEVDRL